MDVVIVPGYRDLLGDPQYSYEELLIDVSSEIIIILMIALNNELNVAEDGEQTNQQRIWEILTERLSLQQKKYLENAIERYRVKKTSFNGLLFGRRYLLGMLLKEFRRNKVIGDMNTTPNQEYRILLAHFQVVDELNAADEPVIKVLAEDNYSSVYKMLWLSFINQYEFNDEVDPAFEMIKLLCFCKYSYTNLRPYLKELLSKYNFSNLSGFLSSFNQLLQLTFTDHPNKLFKKLNLIVPGSYVDTKHLNAQSINHLIGNQHIALSDIRKFPLFKTFRGEFIIIDEDMYRKKVYRGPFFEIFHETSLKKTKDFNQYSTDISTETMEKICFRSICKILAKPKCDVLHFDQNSQSQPDAFYLNDTTIIMIEFKDYIFKEELTINRDFHAFKKYIYEKFVKSDKRRPKGITQLANQIQLLHSKKYEFDPAVNKVLETGKSITIYPIICYSDFMFSLPGVNNYLNQLFQEFEIYGYVNLTVKPVTMMNVEKLFHYSFTKGSFLSLPELINNYWTILNNEKQKLKSNFSETQLIQTMSSFDIMYEAGRLNSVVNNTTTPKDIQHEFFKLIDLNQQQIDEYL